MPYNRSRSTQVVIWTNLVVHEHPMLPTKFQGHRPFGSGEEDFFKDSPYMGMAAILIMWPGPLEQTFVPPSHGGSIWNLTLIGQVVSEEMFENVDVRRTMEACLYYKLTRLFFFSSCLSYLPFLMPHLLGDGWTVWNIMVLAVITQR